MNGTSLLRNMPSGDMEALNRLIMAYQDQAYTLAYYLLGDEVMAEAATHGGIQDLWRELVRQSTTMTRSTNAEVRTHFLTAVLRACARMKHRRYGKIGPGANLSEEKLHTCLASLAFYEHAALVLVDVLKLDYSEAAAIIEQPVDKLRRHLALARHRLCQSMRS